MFETQKVRRHDKFRGKNGLNVRTIGTGPGVRRSKSPLLASRTRCNVLWKPPKFGNKVKVGNKVQSGNKFANWCNVWSIEGVIVHGHVPECRVTFGRGRLHNVWYDPHIDHKTSWEERFQTFHDISLSEGHSHGYGYSFVFFTVLSSVYRILFVECNALVGADLVMNHILSVGAGLVINRKLSM